MERPGELISPGLSIYIPQVAIYNIVLIPDAENPPLTPPKRGITNKREIIPLLGGVRGGSYFNTANKSQLESYS
jgi:hypothetical protein